MEFMVSMTIIVTFVYNYKKLVDWVDKLTDLHLVAPKERLDDQCCHGC